MTFPRLLLYAAVSLTLSTGLFGQTEAPSLVGLEPASVPVGAPGFVLTVSGTNFRSGATVRWNGIPLTTSSFVGTNQVRANVPALLLSGAGTVLITVFNPGVAVASNALSFAISGSPITIATSTLVEGSVGVAYSTTLTATGGTPPYTWTAVGALPAGLSLSPAGVLSGTPTVAGSFPLTVQVTDAGNQTANRAMSLVITAPVLSIVTPSPLPPAMAGQNYTQTLSATNGTAPYRWAAGQGLPAGLSLNANTGTITGAPTAAGVFSFPIRVTDSRDATATRSFELTIEAAPLAITTVSPLFGGTVGAPYAQTLTVSGGVAPYNWTITSGQAPGLTLNASTGVLQGTPSTAGTFSITARVADSTGSAVSREFSVVISPPSLTIPTPSTLPNGSIGISYSQMFTVVGGAAPYTWSLVSGGVPGLTFDPVTGTLSGIPTAAGAFTFSVSVHDVAGASATRTFTITINSAALRITSDAQLPEGTLASEFSTVMTASGGAGPYTWSATGLPEGLSIEPATGIISGTPAAAGNHAFTVRVTDSLRATAIDLFRIQINLPPAPGAVITGLPDVAGAAQQFAFRVSLNDVYLAPIQGQAILSFAPDSGVGDNTIQFATGGRTANFTIAADTLDPVSTAPLALQTGTVAGTITVSLRLTAGGIDITPTPAPTAKIRIERAAPVIKSARLIRNATGFGIEITGSSTAREVTQASFTFAAAAGQSLQSTTVVVPVEDLFSKWYQDPASGEFGSQFVFTQPFNVQGDASGVVPQSVTLTNRLGSVTAQIQQ